MFDDEIEIEYEDFEDSSCENGPKRVKGYIKLQIPAGVASTNPPVGPALSQYGIDVSAFIDEFNEETRNFEGQMIPTVITVCDDNTFTFVVKTPPVVVQKKASGTDFGPGANPEKVEAPTIEKAKEIAKMKGKYIED